MGAIMMILAISVAGEARMLAARFDSIAECESKRGEIVSMVKESEIGGSKIEYVAASCVVPVKVDVA